MDANQPAHYQINIYADHPNTGDAIPTTLCPGARHLARPRLVENASLVTCRRCGELLDVLDLRGPF